MNNATQSSLREILDYLHADEERHWMEAGQPKTGHIFHDIIKVTEWLDAAQKQKHATDTQHTAIARDGFARRT
jgi:hypothetical protein